jgi:tetratricopeptide (TPR) repeat protein
MSDTTSPQDLAKEGKSFYNRGEYQAAAQAFEAAAQQYRLAKDTLNAAEMANNCSVAHLQADDAQAALNAVQGTDDIFAQAGDIRRQGMALGNQAAALEALDRLEEAAETYLRAADVLKQAGEDKLRADVMQSLSMLQFRSGKQLQALASMKSGIDGIEHPSAKQKLIKNLLRVPFEMLNKNRS